MVDLVVAGGVATKTINGSFGYAVVDVLMPVLMNQCVYSVGVSGCRRDIVCWFQATAAVG